MRVDATIPPAVDAMKELKKSYEPVTYAGAGHGFMRAGEPNAPEPKAPAAQRRFPRRTKKATDDYQNTLAMYKANRKARDDAWGSLESYTGKALVSAGLVMTKRTTVTLVRGAAAGGDRIPGFQTRH